MFESQIEISGILHLQVLSLSTTLLRERKNRKEEEERIKGRGEEEKGQLPNACYRLRDKKLITLNRLFL